MSDCRSGDKFSSHSLKQSSFATQARSCNYQILVVISRCIPRRNIEKVAFEEIEFHSSSSECDFALFDTFAPRDSKAVDVRADTNGDTEGKAFVRSKAHL